MREENKLNKAIQQDGIDTQSEILEELKHRYPQYVEQSKNKQTSTGKRRFAFISAIATAVVCAAIIVPCVVLLPNKDNGSNGGKENIRYCTQNDYYRDDAEFTIGEYRENYNRNFLYFDWYEFGEDCNTVRYVSNVDNEVLCLEENIFLPLYDESVQLSITKSNVFLDVFDFCIASCTNEQTVGNHIVKWDVTNSLAICIFEDKGYRYFIQIEEGQDENRLFELVAELLETK